MPKLTAHYSKKLPVAEYANQQYCASIEAEIEETDPAMIKAGIRRLFTLVKEAVEEQYKGAPVATHAASRPQAGQRTAPPARNGAAPSNGRHIPATASQKK